MMTTESSTSMSALVRESAVKFRDSIKDLDTYRKLRRTTPGFDLSILDQMRGMGWFGLLIAENHGGVGLGFPDMAAIVEELGGALLGEPLLNYGVLAPRAIICSNNPAFQDRMLPQMASGEVLAAVAWQEHANNIDPTQIETTAQARGDGVVLSGAKRFVAGSGLADAFLVSARAEDGGIDLYWIAKDAPGLTVTEEWRADGSGAARLRLDNVQVPAAHAVSCDGAGAAALAQALDETRIIASAELVGNMRRVLEMTLDYLRDREQFGQPIGKFQVLQHRAVDMYIRSRVSAAVVAEAATRLDGGATATDIRHLASRAKNRAGDAAVATGLDSIQLHGAFGFTDECDVGLYLKRSLVLNAWLGGPAQHRGRLTDWVANESVSLSQAGQPVALDAKLRERFEAIMSLPAEQRNWEIFEDEEFRTIAANFFQTNLPKHLRYLHRRPVWTELKEWYQLLGSSGWLAPSWPAEYGGMGLSSGKLILYFEEMGRAGAPKHLEQGINHLGPLLIARGTEEQKRKYLPKILTGEHIWCQGYSEPNAGSDLASLKTKAELVGDEFIVNGQKIWTTMAHQATHMYALVRTGRGERKQQGISFLILDLAQPGITIRPIRNIAGEEEFCEVFLDNARTPRDNLVGDLDDGWRVSRALLGFERLTVGSPRYCQVALARLRHVANNLALTRDPQFVDQLNKISLDVADLGSLYQQASDEVKKGNVPGPEISILKVLASETLQKVTELLVESTGELGVLQGEQQFGDQTFDILSPFLDLRSVTISAGSSQVQRNVLAKRVLAL